MDFIIGTAGHIDHGKTELIKALTGIDSHHHKEEKERGITIDIGYAWINAPDGNKIGIIDVPGHERFIHNMLAGITGIDLVLFTIAADDGIMPQTIEHFDILNLLKLSRGIFVITKSDRVNNDRILQLKQEISAFIENSTFVKSPILSVSALTGEGIPQLKDILFQQLSKIPQIATSPYFRLPIDRIFSKTGFGTVITGTVISGDININDKIKLLPSGKIFKIRGMQRHGDTVTQAVGGQRIALNLSDVSKEEISRGEMACHPFYQKSTSRFDAWIEFLPTIPVKLKSYGKIHFHIWTSEVMAQLVLLERDSLQPGESCYCQIIAREPLQLLKDDRFIIRDETATYTLGGGIILDPFANKHKPANPKDIAELEILKESNPSKMIELFCQKYPYSGINLHDLNERLNLPLPPDLIDPSQFKLINQQDSEILFTLEGWNRLKKEIIHHIQQFHQQSPSAPGQDLETFRNSLPASLPQKIFRIIINELIHENQIILKDNRIAYQSHIIQFSPLEETVKKEILSLFHERIKDPPPLKELPTLINRDSVVVYKLFKTLLQIKEIIRLSEDVYLTRHDLRLMILKIVEYGKSNPTFKISDIRDLLQSSRKIVVPLMEYLDRAGVTLRKGDIRVLKIKPGDS